MFRSWPLLALGALVANGIFAMTACSDSSDVPGQTPNDSGPAPSDSLRATRFDISDGERVLIEMAFVKRRVDIRVLAGTVRLRPGR